MLSNEQQKELIDSYIKGKLSPEESSVFENNLNTSVAFKNEFDLQSSIVQTLRANRKAELKQRLNNIEVSTTLQNWWKYAAVAALIATIGVGLYVNKKQLNDSKFVDAEEVTGQIPTQNTIQGVTIINEVSKEDKHEIAEHKLEKVNNRSISNKTTKKSVGGRKYKEELPNLPNLHSPEGGGVHEPISKELDAPDHSLTKTPHISASVAGVEVIKSKKHKFHYRYFDNKLFLYGNFDANTYDILELNTSKGQSLYLKFENNYYGLEPNKIEISKLEQVRDHQIAKELEEIEKK